VRITLRTRLFIAFLLLTGLGFYALTRWLLDDLRPRYLATMEESLVDSATVLSSLLAADIRDGAIDPRRMRAAFHHAGRQRFSAKIYEMTKDRVNMRVYVTDRRGIVVFDSDHGRDEGKDYSRWNDVCRTLRGEYGARATRAQPDDPTSETLYVASPIRVGDEIAGVLTVAKPANSLTLFVQTAKKNIIGAGVLAGLVVVLLGMAVSHWITRPIRALTAHARAVRDGQRAPVPALGRSEIGLLGEAFEEMRDALEGKQYVESYVQALTHEMKSPLSAIQGAAELLDEDMPSEERRRFLDNIRAEAGRMRDLVDRLLELSSLESRKELRDVEDILVRDLVAEIRSSVAPLLSEKGLSLQEDIPGNLAVKGERFLVRQALANLLQNAIAFSPRQGIIRAEAEEKAGRAEIRILDGGPGIPEYALGRVFERFYSLRRPDTGKKSSGLGLTIAREVALLHGGDVRLENRAGGGACAILALPLSPAEPAA
jgi:two-component system sensor histidine kinase CreC